jgi:hypothetical protein
MSTGNGLLRNLFHCRGQNVPNNMPANPLNRQLTATYFAASSRLTASTDGASARLTRPSNVTSNVTSNVMPASISRQTTEQANLAVAANPLALAYQAARDQINEAVAPYLGESALQRGLTEGIDVSPEATADRIADMSTRLFPAYARQQPNIPFDELRDRFVDVIASGVERGFEEARNILQGLKVLAGDIATNVDTTFDLVMERLNAFREQDDV